MTTYVALLRGINLGSHNKIAMSDLRSLFVLLGHFDARTYINSGNVIFSASGAAAKLASDIEKRITRDLGKDIAVLLRTGKQLMDVVEANPFGDVADLSKLSVTFLDRMPPADPPETPKGEAARFAIVGREVYLHSPGGYAATKLGLTFFERHAGALGTTRGWKTVLKLAELTNAGR